MRDRMSRGRSTGFPAICEPTAEGMSKVISSLLNVILTHLLVKHCHLWGFRAVHTMYERKRRSEKSPIRMDWKSTIETRVSDRRHFTAADKLATISSPLGHPRLQTVVHWAKTENDRSVSLEDLPYAGLNSAWSSASARSSLSSVMADTTKALKKCPDSK